MTTTTSLYATCERLFADYPLAVEDVSGDGQVRSIALMLPGRDVPEFFNLCWWPGNAAGDFSLNRWATTDEVPGDEAAHVLANAVPLPRDGSMFGWLDRGSVTAVMVIYAEYSPEHPVPGWAVSPLAGTRQGNWPPFTGATLAESRFWDHYAAGQIVNLAPLVAETRSAVFWVTSPAPLYSCCAVAYDVTAPQGWMLPQGVYAYFETLRNGEPVPSLDDLLADSSKLDLAPGFQEG